MCVGGGGGARGPAGSIGLVHAEGCRRGNEQMHCGRLVGGGARLGLGAGSSGRGVQGGCVCVCGGGGS